MPESAGTPAEAVSIALQQVLAQADVGGIGEVAILQRAHERATALLMARRQEEAASAALELVLAEGTDGLSESEILARAQRRAAEMLLSSAASARTTPPSSSRYTPGLPALEEEAQGERSGEGR